MSGFRVLFSTAPQEPRAVAVDEDDDEDEVVDRQEEEELARPIAKKIGQLLTSGVK